ncbi:DUF2314 domain-containing protein [Motilimonas cestriensis]|uniref:DUF2314 domain-containing protein n=1 Tax=Motilimonas cestriensis TaxID=2742685 RepID=A0ABS8WC69_9GAMM|nr:DUF2314 domain-containing protein [Motilimonas cestriensis]MCE2596143.1 DUF2314 domain-containing protein [Motilimonas cestriensis]
MKQLLFCLLLLIPAVTTAAEKIDDQVVMVSDQNPAMNAAIKKARSTLKDFFAIAANPPAGANNFKLKVMVTDDNGVEHLWFSPFKQVEGGYAGLLVNEPDIVSSMTFGEIYVFSESQITDWGYELNGKQVGSYTVCALFLTMDKAVVEQYKKDHGFECES